MSTLGLYSMDCTLRTWPSVTQQIDDLMWSGLGDIDSLESLDQMDGIIPWSPPSLPDSVFESKAPAVLSTKEDPDSATVILNLSLEAEQSDCVNSSELSSVLDDSFNCGSVSSVPAMGNGYKPYDIVLNLDDNLSMDADDFMEDPLREPVQMLDASSSSLSITRTHKQETAECILGGQETTMPNLGAARNSHLGVPTPTPYLLHDKIGYCLGTVPTSSTVSLCPSGVLQAQASVPQQFHTLLQSPQKLASSVANNIQSKAKNAQASRARRFAPSQRRVEGQARKYPLHKLIRMSAASKSSCDKLSPSSATLGPAVQARLSTIPKQEFGISGRGQAFQSNHLNQQMTYVPMVIHDSQGIPFHLPLRYPVLACSLVHPGQRMGLHQWPASYCEIQNQCVASEGAFGQCHLVQQPLETSSVLYNPSSSLDMTLLKQLQSIVVKLNGQTRMRIRDSLHRLAKNAKERQWRMDERMSDWKSSKCQDMIETQTNPMDRRVASLLFCKHLSAFEVNMSPGIHEAAKQQMLHTPNVAEPWNSCVSCMNLQDQPPHILTG